MYVGSCCQLMCMFGATECTHVPSQQPPLAYGLCVHATVMVCAQIIRGLSFRSPGAFCKVGWRCCITVKVDVNEHAQYPIAPLFPFQCLWVQNTIDTSLLISWLFVFSFRNRQSLELPKKIGRTASLSSSLPARHYILPSWFYVCAISTHYFNTYTILQI